MDLNNVMIMTEIMQLSPSPTKALKVEICTRHKPQNVQIHNPKLYINEWGGPTASYRWTTLNMIFSVWLYLVLLPPYHVQT
jgi:hypothetical protein